MAEVKIRRMTADEFLGWDSGDDERYELVDGVPRMMTGARRGHDEVVVNALTALRDRLRGSGCRPYTDDLAVRIPNGNVRRPDITVDCDPQSRDDLSARAPVLVIEVLSPSNGYDLLRKLIEYKSVAAIRYILVLDPAQPAATLYERQSGELWRESALIGADTELAFDALGITLPLGIFYEDVL